MAPLGANPTCAPLKRNWGLGRAVGGLDKLLGAWLRIPDLRLLRSSKHLQMMKDGHEPDVDRGESYPTPTGTGPPKGVKGEGGPKVDFVDRCGK